MSSKPMGRRKFLGYLAGGLVVGGVVGAGGGYLAAPPKEVVKEITKTATTTSEITKTETATETVTQTGAVQTRPLRVFSDADEPVPTIWAEISKASGIPIEYTAAGGADRYTKVVAASVAKKAPWDVVHLWGGHASGLAAGGHLLDLTRYLPKELMDNLSVPMHEPVSFDRGLYRELRGVCCVGDATMAWYRNDIYEKEGFKEPEPDQALSLDDWIGYAETVYNPPDMYGLVGYELWTVTWSGIAVSYGYREWMQEDVGGKKLWVPTPPNKTPVVECMYKFIELYKYAVPGSLTFDYPDCRAAFAGGNVLQTSSWSGMYPYFNDPNTSKIVGNFRSCVSPGKKGDTEWWASGAPDYHCVSAYSDMQEIAARFIAAAHTPEEEKEWFFRAGANPTNLATYNLPEVIAYSPWLMKTVAYTVAHAICWGKVGALMPHYTEIGDSYRATVQDAIAGKKTPEKAFDDWYAYAIDVLKKAGYLPASY